PPYSAALISLSVPSTPTRRMRTRTPRPPGMSLTAGFGSSARCTEPGRPGNTAIAFIILGLESPAGVWPSRVEVCAEGMTTSPREWLLALVRGGDLENVAAGAAHAQP